MTLLDFGKSVKFAGKEVKISYPLLKKFKNDKFVTSRLLKGRFYEEQMLKFIHENLKTPGIIIDAGAQVGNHTLFFCYFLSAKYGLFF